MGLVPVFENTIDSSSDEEGSGWVLVSVSGDWMGAVMVECQSGPDVEVASWLLSNRSCCPGFVGC